MLLIRVLALALLLMLAGIALPASAHENHQREQVEETAKRGDPGSTRHVSRQEAAEEPGASVPVAAGLNHRLMDWLGRTHPFAVHFPIALFPVAWIALIFARRRAQAVDLVRALIIVAGVAAPVAALFGWFDAGWQLVDRDPIQTWHRWTGSALAMLGAMIGIWAWRRPWSVNSGAMVWTLAGLTALAMAQGWLGAALVHGVEHLKF